MLHNFHARNGDHAQYESHAIRPLRSRLANHKTLRFALNALLGVSLLFSTAGNAAAVPSIKPGASIEISGFEAADEDTHMIAWLGKGKDFRRFVVKDVESELYAQDRGAQVLSVQCKSKPDYRTRTQPTRDAASKAIVTGLSVTFPLAVRIRAADGKIWRLEIRHDYVATGLDTPGNQRLILNFDVVAQQLE